MSYDKDGITYNDKNEPLPWESDHIADVTNKADSLPWFKDMFQVKRFVQGRAYRSFKKSELTPEEKRDNDMIDSIFGLSK